MAGTTRTCSASASATMSRGCRGRGGRAPRAPTLQPVRTSTAGQTARASATRPTARVPTSSPCGRRITRRARRRPARARRRPLAVPAARCRRASTCARQTRPRRTRTACRSAPTDAPREAALPDALGTALAAKAQYPARGERGTRVAQPPLKPPLKPPHAPGALGRRERPVHGTRRYPDVPYGTGLDVVVHNRQVGRTLLRVCALCAPRRVAFRAQTSRARSQHRKLEHT